MKLRRRSLNSRIQLRLEHPQALGITGPGRKTGDVSGEEDASRASDLRLRCWPKRPLRLRAASVTATKTAPAAAPASAQLTRLGFRMPNLVPRELAPRNCGRFYAAQTEHLATVAATAAALQSPPPNQSLLYRGSTTLYDSSQSESAVAFKPPLTCLLLRLLRCPFLTVRPPLPWPSPFVLALSVWSRNLAMS